MYCHLANGAAFTNPITKHTAYDYAAQYVDNKIEMVSIQGIHPTFNHTNQKIQHETGQTTPGGQIHLRYPITKSTQSMSSLKPREARRTLGAMLTPDGSATTQINMCLNKIEVFVGKLSNCRLSQHLRWQAIKLVLEPGLWYPLMATLFESEELTKIELKMSHSILPCCRVEQTFSPCGIVWSCRVGWNGNPKSTIHAHHITFKLFFYHTRWQTEAGIKLEISLAHIQIEVGTCAPVLSTPFCTYGHLATHSLIKCLWAKTINHNMFIQRHKEVTWHPQPQGPSEISIMDLALVNFSKQHTIMINHCHIYPKVFTIYDLFTQDSKVILPAIEKGKPVQSRHSPILWIKIPKPLKKYWGVWYDFLNLVKNYTQAKQFVRNLSIPNHYITLYYYCTGHGTLQEKNGNTYHTYTATARQPTHRQKKFFNVQRPQIRHIGLSSLQQVDVHHTGLHIYILCYHRTTGLNIYKPNNDTTH